MKEDPTNMTLVIDNQTASFDDATLPFEHAFHITNNHLEQGMNATLILLDEAQMFITNNQLRQKPKPTDVLSIALEDDIGEVYICPNYVFSQGHDPERIIHLWVHGLLHTAGYTHDDDNDFLIMRTKESEILRALEVEDPYV